MIKFLRDTVTDTFDTKTDTAKSAVIVDNHSIMADINRLFDSPADANSAVPTDAAADALIQKATESINKSNELLSPAAEVPTKKRPRKTRKTQEQEQTTETIVPPLTDAEEMQILPPITSAVPLEPNTEKLQHILDLCKQYGVQVMLCLTQPKVE